MNESGLRPLGVAVLLKMYEPEQKKGVIVIPEEAKQKLDYVNQRAIVVEVGPEAWIEEKEPRAKPGDKVMVAKYSGVMVKGTKDGESYRLVNDRDIFCQITEE